MRINWRKILIAIMLILLACVLVGCIMEDGKNDPEHKTEFKTTNPSGWEEGKFYHNRGKDTTIYSQPFEVIEFNKKLNEYDTSWYQKRSSTMWEHKYTPGGMREDIWYWDEKSGTWYSFNRSGDYYVFRWIERIGKLDNYVEN